MKIARTELSDDHDVPVAWFISQWLLHIIKKKKAQKFLVEEPLRIKYISIETSLLLLGSGSWALSNSAYVTALLCLPNMLWQNDFLVNNNNKEKNIT